MPPLELGVCEAVPSWQGRKERRDKNADGHREVLSKVVLLVLGINCLDKIGRVCQPSDVGISVPWVEHELDVPNWGPST